MEDELYGMVRGLFNREDGQSLFSQPEELTDECYLAARAVTLVLLNKHLKKKLKWDDMNKHKFTPIMYMANIWGLQIYLKQMAMGGVYLSPACYTDNKRVKEASQATIRKLAEPADIDRVAEAVMDRFTGYMMPALKDTGLKISKRIFKRLLEANIRWGYEFGREIEKGTRQ